METKLYSLRLVNVLSRGKVEMVNKLVQVFINQTPQSLEVLKAAYQSGDYTIVRSVAHKIKPTYGYFEISATEKNLELIEILAGRGEASAELESIIQVVEEQTKEVINLMKADFSNN